jgi:KDO2-lipid IV(A) lauroyltransferase
MSKPSLTGRLFFLLAGTICLLPLAFLRMSGRALGWLSYRMNTRECHVARRNLQLIHPQIPPDEREIKLRELLSSTGQTVFETLAAWTRPRRRSLKLIRNVYGLEYLQKANAAGQGVLLATPHYGNWELLLQFMAEQVPLSVVYNPPDSLHLDSFLYLARNADTVHMVPAEVSSMRPLLRALQKGETVGITPDQQPKRGGGEFVPFFGIPSLTLSLIAKLAHRSGAPVLFSFCERNDDGTFDVYIEADEPGLRNPDLLAAMSVMNNRVQAMAERDFRQYQWTYKRYSIRPDPSEKNPYK